jgi:deoxyribodipyrimidine photo-lyase
MDGRFKALNARPTRDGDYVLYWMQQSQRAAFNPALEYAVAQANDLGLPVVVGFGLTDAYPDANLRHFAFMLEGLAEVRRDLARRKIAFVIRKGSPQDVAVALAKRAALVVCDRGYLRHQRAWRDHVAKRAQCRVVQIEGDVVVPVETASDKHEIAARTLRPKIMRALDAFLLPCPAVRVKHPAPPKLKSDIDLDDLPGTLRKLKVDRGVGPVTTLRGGTHAARRHLDRFIEDGLATYGSERTKKEESPVSLLSPYLHFGQISPVEIVLKVLKAGPSTAAYAFIEQLVVRRELTFNHVRYDDAYDRYEGLPDWAKQTLAAHRRDRRAYLYDRAAFEESRTHEPVWNAAMTEMKLTGYLHSRLRMYWGKKILEWSADPKTAFETALALNNKYFLDGRDPNSYSGVAWCFGLHDRPWPIHPIFGTVRSQGLNSLRAFDLDAYVARIAKLARQQPKS